MKKSFTRFVALMLVLASLLIVVPVFAEEDGLTSNASQPQVYFSSKNAGNYWSYNNGAVNILYLDYYPQYKTERISVGLFKGSSCVWASVINTSNTSTGKQTRFFSLNASGVTPGTYTLEVFVEYFTIFGWQLSTSHDSETYTVKSLEKKNVSSITLKADKTTVTLKDGEASIQLKATIKPSGASSDVSWSSSDKSIATVSSKGLVKFKKAGSVTITCKATDGSKVKGTIKLTAKPQKVISFNLYKKGNTNEPLEITTNKSKAKTAITLKKGKTVTLVADDFNPDSVTDKTVVWKSLNTKIVTVSNGKLKGVAKGTATIQVSPKSNSKLVYYFKVKVQ